MVLQPGFRLAVWVDTTSVRAGPFGIGFDNASVYWEKAEDKYPDDGPPVQPTSSFASSDIYQWHGFQETAIKDDRTEIFYQLSNDDGSTWWFVANDTWKEVSEDKQYNTADEINKFIPLFPADNQRIMFKAFLVSDGRQQVVLDNVRFEYLIAGGVGYYTFGSFESSSHDTGTVSPVYSYLAWNADTPIATRLEFQIRTANTESGLASAVWSGPDGDSNTRYTTPGQVIITNPGASGIRWIQYKIYFYSNGIDTPILRDVTIDYER
mgnify:CR=1 FL=1